MIVMSSRNLGKRSINPNSLVLEKDIALGPGAALSGLGFSLSDTPNMLGYAGYAAAGLLVYYLLFHSSRAKERRAELKKVGEQYKQARSAVYAKYGRI